MKKVGIVSLGCMKNRVDSENILGLFDRNGYEITNDPSDSDVIVINTCGFIESSKKESIENILEMIQYGKKVVVTGCLAERYLEELKKEIPEVDLYIPIREYSHFNEKLYLLDKEIDKSLGVDDEYRIVSTGPYSAYLKIGEGCDNRCSYCAIPLIRGHFVSRPFDQIIKEANELAEAGIKEIIVLEQDTTKYGIDLKNGENIVDLLKALLEIKEFEYIRLLYLYPDEISDELIELIGKEKRLTPYFDVPIQHSENHILKDMFRRGDKKFLISLFNKIREKVPNAILRTTVMVGFPGETEEDVDNLISFMNEVKFDHLGAFTYSQEEGTPSASFPNQIDEEIKKKRLAKVMKAQQKISYSLNKRHIGEVMRGMVIGKDDHGNYLLRSYWNAPDDVDGKIYFTSKRELHNGDMINVKITGAFVYDLMGEENE
ncbi:MAG: 30S ribosomal protein S12 methylthiotransferase RimO [Bacilli bacterium]|nr:30S ribosomal protein S12 methylthiotransferase RimO [Bacilli bacterium]